MNRDRNRRRGHAERETAARGTTARTSTGPSPASRDTTSARTRAARTCRAAGSRCPPIRARACRRSSAVLSASRYCSRTTDGTAITSSPLSRSRNRAARSKGNVSSSGSMTWKTMTSVPRNRKCRSPSTTRAGIVEQIGDEHHHAALGDPVGELVQRLRHVRLVPEHQAVERHQDGPQVARPARSAAASTRSRRRRSSGRPRHAAGSSGRPATPRASTPYSSLVMPREP